MNRPARLFALTLTLVAAASLAASPAAAEPPADEQLEVYHLRFASVKEVHALLRGVVNVRRTAVNEKDASITVRAPASALREIEALLEEWDVPPAGWRGRLVADTGSREHELAAFRLEDEKFQSSFGGGSSPGLLSVQLTVRELRRGSLDVDYDFLTQLNSSRDAPQFRRAESGRTQLTGRGEQVVVAASTDPERARLAELLGVERPVERVLLRLSPER